MLFPVPYNWRIPTLPQGLRFECFILATVSTGSSISKHLEGNPGSTTTSEIYSPSLMPFLCFQGTSRQSCSNIQLASSKSTKPGYKHTLDAEKPLLTNDYANHGSD
jgi:hypothetical protein